MLTLKKEHAVLLALLRYELFGIEPKNISADTDWSAVFEEGIRHAVSPLLFRGLNHMESVPEEVLSRAYAMAVSSTQMSEQMLQEQQKIIDCLHGQGIPCAILKGFSAACMYPHPELRVPGDIDLYVGEENFSKSCRALEEFQFTLARRSEKHWEYRKNGIDLEVHPAVSKFPDTEKGNFTREFVSSAWQHIETAQIMGISFPCLEGEYQLFSLLTHMENHVTSDGIGLRQLCDWAVAVNHLRSRIDDGVLSLLEQCGLLYFAKSVTRLCEVYLGMPPAAWSEGVSEETLDALMRDILEGGNFASQGEHRAYAYVLTDAYHKSENKKKSILCTYFKFVRRKVRYEYPWAKSWLWVPLFSIFFPIRVAVRVILGKRKKFRIRDTIRCGKERAELLQSLNLYK